jgi:hypothetical protein
LDGPSAEVRAFIDAFVESIDFLRVLLVLARNAQRDWSATALGAATSLPAEVAAALAQRISTVGLASATQDAPPAYRYTPRAAEFAQMVQELIELDDRMPVTLIRLVYARKQLSAQAFADAFRLRGP